MNFNKTIFYGLMLNLLLLTQPTSAMIRRFTPAATAKFMATALVASKRTLLQGQENHPLWIKANKDIKDFYKKHNLSEDQLLSDWFFKMASKDKKIELETLSITEQQISLNDAFAKLQDEKKNLETTEIGLHDYKEKNRSIAEKQRQLSEEQEHLEKKCKWILNSNFMIFAREERKTLNMRTQPKNELEQTIINEIKGLLMAHNVTRQDIKIVFDDNDDDTNNNSYASVLLFTIRIHKPLLECDTAKRKAIIEHEICHIIQNDSLTTLSIANLELFSNEETFSPKDLEHYVLLKEKRADIHSAIQSLDNAKNLPKFYSERFQFKQLADQVYDKSRKADLKLPKNYLKEAIDYHKKLL